MHAIKKTRSGRLQRARGVKKKKTKGEKKKERGRGAWGLEEVIVSDVSAYRAPVDVPRNELQRTMVV